MLRNLGLLLLFTAPLIQAANTALKPLVRQGGKAPMALVVGINTYKDPGITPLRGAVKDAHHMVALLTDPQGYGFPDNNVILLTDEDATRRNVLDRFQKGLINRAKTDDPVVIFFSCHGSQGPDLNKDEPDGRDEILLLHDSTNFALGLWDDEFNHLLRQLYRKTKNITVILDACHSESGTRTGGQVRAAAPNVWDPNSAPTQQPAKSRSDGGVGMASIDPRYKPRHMPELVVITAAKDGTPSFDGPKGGLFTLKLITALSRLNDSALTYSQVEREVHLALSHTKLQVPNFQGKLDKPVFGMSQRERPITWAVQDVKEVNGKHMVELLGSVMPGLSKGAILRLYPQTTTGKAWLDPSRAHGELVVAQIDGLRVLAQVIKASRPILKSDRAVLVLPGEDAVQLNYRVRVAAEAEALPKAMGDELAVALREDGEAKLSLHAVTQADGEADFELVYRDGAVVLLDGMNQERGRFATSATYWAWNLVQTLNRHARIKAILALAGDDGGVSDHQRLKIEVVPAGAGPNATAVFNQKRTSGEVLIPKGDKAWYVRVTLTKASEPMHVAGFALSGDGTIFALPVRGSTVVLKEGQSHTFTDQSLRLKPGSKAQDHLVFFASKQRVDWKKLGEDSATRRGARGPGAENALFQRLNLFLTPGQRSGSTVEMEGDTSFSRTAVRLTVE